MSGWLFLLLAGTAISGCRQSSQTARSSETTRPSETAPLRFDCASFPREFTAQDLGQRFGASQVKSVSIPLGEGETGQGTVLFPDDPERKVEILWNDPGAKRNPRSVKIQGSTSRWIAPGGLCLGLDLEQVETLNHGPFRLAGFGWDRGGSVTSWSGGALETNPCQLRARFAVDSALQNDPRLKTLMGDREFSSDDATMHALKPRVVEVWLSYGS